MGDVGEPGSPNGQLPSFRSLKNQDAIFSQLQNWDSTDVPLAPLTNCNRHTIQQLSDLYQQPSSSQQLFDSLVEDGSKLSETGSDEVLRQPSKSDLDTVITSQQFYSWFGKLSDDMVAVEDQVYSCYIDELSSCRQQCSLLLAEVDSSVHTLADLVDRYNSVSDCTAAVYHACDALLSQQTKMSNQVSVIEQKLSHFRPLSAITYKLDQSSFSVNCQDFLPVLAKIDECIQYMELNENYQEAASYLSRFRQCQWRSLAMLRTYVSQCLEAATAATSSQTGQGRPRPHETELTGCSPLTLAYSRFRVNSGRVKRLTELIEERCHLRPVYGVLLEECHQCYFRQRHHLVASAAHTAMTKLTERHTRDHCSMLRSGCAFMVHLCEDEYQLFYLFFSTHSEQLNEFLASLCSNLHDVFRPLIIQANHLETLAELSSILSVEMLDEHVYNNPVQLAPFGGIVRQLLQDVQERLVYRTHVYIQTDIQQYRPSPGDLAYPDKLIMIQNISDSLEERRSSVSHAVSSCSAISRSPSVSSEASTSLRTRNYSTSPVDLHGMWYPTVRRTLVCLSKLYRCTERSVFQGLSHEALTACVDSLAEASRQISANKTNQDALLFEIKHMLILREQIVPFQVDFSVKEISVDLNKMKTAALDLVQRRSQLFSFGSNNALLAFLLDGAPGVQQRVLDSRRQVDARLKLICERFISLQQTTLTQPLCRLITALESCSADEHRPLTDVTVAAAAVKEAQQLLSSQLPAVKYKLHLYLANPQTEAILFKPIKVWIMQRFEQLLSLCVSLYSAEDQLIVQCPSSEHIGLLIASAMLQPFPPSASPTQPPATTSTTTEPHATTSTTIQPPATTSTTIQPHATTSTTTQPHATTSTATEPHATTSTTTQPPATTSTDTQPPATASTTTQPPAITSTDTQPQTTATTK